MQTFILAFVIAATAGYVHAQTEAQLVFGNSKTIAAKQQVLAEKEIQLHALQKASMGHAMALQMKNAMNPDLQHMRTPMSGDLVNLHMRGFMIKALNTEIEALKTEIELLQTGAPL